MSRKSFSKLSVVVGAFLVLVVLGWPQLLGWYEDAVFAVKPTAERAYRYGTRHLDVKNNARLYDTWRAEHYLLEAVRIDPRYPYAYHQLARLAFLRGNFELALSRIMVEISNHGDTEHNTYYVKGLIEGYMGDYTNSVLDYKEYLRHDPHNWAAINDLSWVLLKAKRFEEAREVLTQGLVYFPENPWLLNSRSIALFEMREYQLALKDIQKARGFVPLVSNAQWSQAYPGNDPAIAGQGVATLRQSIETNFDKITAQLQTKH